MNPEEKLASGIGDHVGGKYCCFSRGIYCFLSIKFILPTEDIQETNYDTKSAVWFLDDGALVLHPKKGRETWYAQDASARNKGFS